MDEERTLENVILEQTLCEALGVKPATLAEWRRRGLPVVRLDRTHRGYWRQDVGKFLAEQLTDGASGRGIETPAKGT